MSYQSEILADSPALYLRFSESAGASTAVDSSVNNVPVTKNGAITFGGAGGISGNACADLVGGHFSLPSIGLGGGAARTLSFILYRKIDTRQVIFSVGDGSGFLKNFIVYTSVVSPGDIYVGFNGRDFYSSGGSVPLNTWTHIAVRYNGGIVNAGNNNVTVRVNGVDVALTPAGPTSGVAETVDANNRIGDSSFDTGWASDFKLDEFSVFNANLSDARISAQYNAWIAGGSLGVGTLTVASKTPTSVTLNYGTVTDGSAPYSNQLQRSSSAGGTYTDIGSPQVGADVTLTDTGLSLGQTWYYRVVTTDGGAIQVTSAVQGVYFASALQNAYVNTQFGAFIHYGIYSGYGPLTPTGNEDPNIFNPGSTLDLDQWLDAIQAAGMRDALITTKHHDGFCLWPSASQPHGIAAGSWYQSDPANRNIVKLFTDKTRARGLRVGLYLSIRDKRWETDNPSLVNNSAAYTGFVTTQITELLGGTYGSIDFIWTDGWGWDVSHGKVIHSTVYNHIKTLQPNCLLVENDHGFNLATSDIIVYESPIQPYPTPTGNLLPAEFAQTIRTAPEEWAWTDDEPHNHLDAATIISRRNQENSRNSIYRLNLTPNKFGLIPSAQVSILRQVGGDTTAPSAVQRVSAVTASSTSVTLKWRNASDTTIGQYKIYQSTNEDTGFTLVRTLQKYDSPHLGTTITGLSTGLTYYFRIAALDYSGNESEKGVNAPYYPQQSEVQNGLTFGPTKQEFSGTLTGGSGGGINGSGILGMI
jgi:alpha-L-fucosidase